MKKGLFFLVWILSFGALAQDRIYIDSIGNSVEKENAKFYRILSEKKGVYHIKDYYLSGKLQMDAYSKDKDFRRLEDLIGKFSFYYENGKVETSGEEIKGKYHYKSFDKKGRLVTLLRQSEPVYQENYIYSDQGFNSLYITENGVVKKNIDFDKDLKKARIECIYETDESVIANYYNNAGKLIASRTYTQKGAKAGTDASYYFSPVQLRKITQWDDNSDIIGEKEYYRSGRIFSEFSITPKDTVAVFYDAKKSKIGVLVYKENHPYQGSEYILNDNGIIAQKNDYKLGFLDQQILYYRTGSPKSKTDYGLYGSIDKITYYEKKDKKEKEVLTFYEGFPYNGYEYNDLEKNNSFIYYEKGSIIEAKQYDDKNILRYHRKKHEDGHIVADIYNEKGKKDINYVITQESKPSSYEGMVHLDFIQYENGKEVRTGRITNGILEKGSIELQLNEKSKNIYRREENWITVEQYYSGELLKIYKINVKHPQFSSIYEGDMDEFFIYERKLSPFVIVGDSMNED